MSGCWQGLDTRKTTTKITICIPPTCMEPLLPAFTHQAAALKCGQRNETRLTVLSDQTKKLLNGSNELLEMGRKDMEYSNQVIR